MAAQYELLKELLNSGTKLDFADGTLTMNLAKYQRDYPVTKTITGDAEGNLLIDGSDSRFYVAEVEIPAIEYEDVEVEGEAENATMTEAVEGETEAQRTPRRKIPPTRPTSSARPSR